MEELKWRVIGLLGKLLVDGLFATTRISQENLDGVRELIRSRRFIFAFWHSRILLVSFLYQGYNGAILVSRSTDGEYIARVLQRQGHEPIRGSTTRGGLRALALLIKRLREADRPGGVIPDGPQGPRFVVQPGVITLAKKTGYPIVPVTYSARKITVFSSWDRFILPWPFTECRVVYGDAIHVPEDADSRIQENRRLALEQELRRITARADSGFGHLIV